MKLGILAISFLLLANYLFGQPFKIERIEPPNWWSGMKLDTVQIMVYGKNIKDSEVYPSHTGAEVLDVKSAESPDYLFIDLLIDKTINSNIDFEIGFSKDGYDTVATFPILKREVRGKAFQGFDQNDIVYLIMADRFCDGNPYNNNIGDSLEQFTSKDLDGRKGGDIEGIISRLPYLKDLGISALWITPMLENNMWMSYHGYAATDLYKIDPRFGSNTLYKELVKKAHEKGLKIIMDHVANHIGINHWWMNDLPFNDWINGTVKNHLPANHNKMTFLDPYSPNSEVEKLWKGWFTDYMPDLNQGNPYLKRYLIQNTIWWIEYLGIDGLREDTYPYCNQYAMSDWAKSIINEYPDFNIVGEVWTGDTPFLAGYQMNNKFMNQFNSNLPCVTDFALSDAVRGYLSENIGFEKVFNVLAMDYLYNDPNNLLTFIDNHDISRALYLAKGDIEKYKIALTILFTTRGIPTILYGTEIGIVGDEKHGNIRSPFPGGFIHDSTNAFTECGRNTFENDIYEYVRNLIEIRNNYKSLSQGRLFQYYPFNKVYVYFRTLENETTMIVINGNEKEIQISRDQFKEIVKSSDSLINIESGEKIISEKNNSIIIPAKSAQILLLEKNKR